MVSYLLIIFAISILVPTPSVHATILGFCKFFGMSVIDPKPPILLNFFLPFFFDEVFDIYLTNLSAALIYTPLFLYVKKLLFITIQYENS